MAASPHPLGGAEIDELSTLLAAVPPPFEPLDAAALDGFLCGVLVQPRPAPERAWWPHVLDIDGRAVPAVVDAARVRSLAGRRHAELSDAIGRRRWFDPWVFAAADEAGAGEEDADAAAGVDGIDAVRPWVAGFTLALETFPRLLESDAADATEPLALLYRHLGADHLEGAEALLAQIDSLAPPQTLSEAVEELVRATLLLADAAGLPNRSR